MTIEGTTLARPTYRVFHYAMLAVVVGAFIASAVAIGVGVREHFRGDPRVSHVRLIAGDSTVGGASSTLTRSDDGADYKFETSGLPQGHVVTLRAMIFNHPEHCAHPSHGLRCGEGDLDTPGVDGSVVFLASGVLRTGSSVKFSGTISTEDVRKRIGGAGLTNPAGADIVFIILDHGQPEGAIFSEQLSSFRGGCTQPGPGETAGNAVCADLQYAPHEH